jgi:ABC-type phosphate transport system substrate-binding protein
MIRARLGRFCALAAVCAGAAFAATTPAAYAVGTEKCEGIKGAGSSLQNIAQKSVWITGFRGGKGWEKSVCENEPGAMEYFSSSSGKGLGQWGANGTHTLKEEEIEGVKVFPTYVGTDVGPEGPSTTAGTQLNEMDEAGKQGTAAGEGAVAVPVAQSAVSVIVQIPAECLNTLKEKEVVSITSEHLEKEWFKNEIKWQGLITGTATGAESKCTTEKVPTTLARFSASGTTAGFKRFLGGVASPDKTTWAPFISTAAKSESASEWPKVPTEEACSTKLEKGSQLAKAVFECEIANGSIGYADLADARAAGFEKEAKLLKPAGKSYYVAIVRVQNNGFGVAPAVYQSPEKAGESNCKKANYFKQTTLEVKGNEDWSGAKEENLEKGEAEAYPICTLTFDVAWHVYEKVPAPTVGGYSEQKANTVFGYLHYIAFEGQNAELTTNHYGVLPTPVKTAAETALTNTNKATRIIRWKP